MNKISCCLLIAIAMMLESKAQTRHIVTFKNKDTNPFSLSNPNLFLSQRSIDRRLRYAIPIDSTDLPITPRYLDSLRSSGSVTILNTSKWLNTVSIQTSDAAAISKINSYSFVKSVSSIAPRISGRITDQTKGENEQDPNPLNKESGLTADFYNYGSSYTQVHIHNGEFLHNIGLRGQSMYIGILDAGFNNYLTVKAFDSARVNGQILGVWDFVVRDSSVNEDNSHGMQCFSIIASNIPGQFVGTAPKASFYLFRSEDAASEYPIEEHNWVCAAERVDSVGGDVLSSSLGYNLFDAPFSGFNHSYADMNGNTTIPAIGADLAAKKGILVVNSAGNEGTNSWKYIITPADGDSVLAVGAVNGAGVIAPFSSYGPSSDGQVKPDVASVGQGTIVQFANNTIGANNGTSFSAPNMAGLTTCLWQGFQEFNNVKIIDALRKSGNMATSPNDRVGYGIPDVKKAVMNLLKDFASSTATIANCKSNVQWTSKDSRGMKYELERMLPGQTVFTKVFEKDATANFFSKQSYSYEDLLSGVQPGNISYRIRELIDTSAAGFTAGYIDTVSVSLPTSCLQVQDAIILFPNPAKNEFSIRITSGTPIPDLSIHLLNATAQRIAVIKRNILPGATRIDIPLAFLASGKYYVNLYNGGRLMVTKEVMVIRQ